MDIQTTLTYLIVLLAVSYVVWKFTKALVTIKPQSACDGCKGCELKSNKQNCSSNILK